MLAGNELVAQIVNFLLLLFILRKFFWKKILQLLDDRKARIAGEFKKIEDTQKEIAQLKSDYEAKMRTIEEAAQQRIHDAIVEARLKAEEIEQRAREDAQKAIEHGSAEIQFQIAKAKEELKQQTIEFTIQAAEHLVEKKFNAEDDKHLVADFIDRIDKMTVG